MWETIQEGGAGALVALGAGLVGSIALRSSTTANPELERCVVEVPKAMSFPIPEGGMVTVTTTIEFTR